MLNITTFLDANARRLNKDVFYFPNRDLRYNSAEILSIISGIGQSLKDKGIEKGDRVLIYLNNSPEYLFSLFGIWRIGAIAIPTNRILTAAELNYMIDDSDAKLIITDEDAKEILNELDTDAYIIENCESFKGSEILHPEETGWDDLCQLQYTSGTTGKPKGSMLTHGNWFTAIHNACDVLTYKENDTFLCIYPMAHVGILWAIAALRAGALTIMMKFFELDEYLELCKDEEVSVLSGMPPVIHTLTNLEDNRKENLATVREIISGGGPLHRKIWKKFMADYNIPIINAYGLSETIVIGTGTVIRPEDYATADRYESVGHPVCFSELKIVEEHNPDKTLGHYEQGEIALRGPAIAKGYWGMEKETKESFLEDGWFLTGDIGYIDDDERLFITDRKKDMIVMSGWKIYPTEVEETLIKYEKIDEIAIFSIGDCHRGELPVAAVVWKDEEDSEGLIEYAKEYLARYKVPRKIFTMDELPRVNGWKLLRRELREMYSTKEE